MKTATPIGPVILGGFVPNSNLLTRFVRVRGGGHVHLPPIFCPPRPCNAADAARLAAEEAKRHGYSKVIIAEAAHPTPVTAAMRKGAA